MKTTKGFTLIELLVVIAIIAILLAVLVPALNVAKEMATGAVCLADIGALAKGWYLYQEENNANIVGGSTYSVTKFRWVERPLLPTSPTTLAENQDPVTWEATGANMNMAARERGIMAGKLWPYIQSVKLYHCPGDKQFKRGTAPYLQRYRSYAVPGPMNSEDMGVRTISNLPGAVTTKVLKGVTKFTEIASPGDKYVFVEEAAGQDYNLGGWVLCLNGNGQSWWDPLAPFHNKRSTLAFADGHAEKHNWIDDRTVDVCKNWENIFNNRNGRTSSELTQLNNKDLDYMVPRYFPKRD